MMASQLELVGKVLLFLTAFVVRASSITSTCSIVEVAGAEDDLSGTYRYDGSETYIRRGGSTSYILGKYNNDQWRLGQGFHLYYALDNYPYYYTFDTASHPVDTSEAWQLIAGSGNSEEAPTSFSITCADTNTSSPITSTCSIVEVAGAEDDLSGTYRYDGDSYIRRGGSTSYILGEDSNDQWLLGQGYHIIYADSNYPYYYTYDIASHPVDTSEAWQLIAGSGNSAEAPTSFSITCADTNTSSPITSTCSIVEVAGAEDDISGTYRYDGDSYIRRGGSTSYILGEDSNDQWLLGQGFNLGRVDNNYPYYYTYDIASHPVDTSEAWQLIAGSGNSAEAPTSFSITCADTNTSSPITSTCSIVEVAGAEDDISGTYRYDGDSYIRRGGSTSYILGEDSNDQWLLGQGFNLGQVDNNYPYYYTYDAASHPVDTSEAWQLIAGSGNSAEAPTSFSITCADTNTSSPITSTCSIVEVAGAEDDLSGTYRYDGDSYIRRGGSTSYILGEDSNDQWLLGQGFNLGQVDNNYPYYYTYDIASHPVDTSEAWQLIAGSGNSVDAPTSFSITCAGICASVNVRGGVGDLSGIYTYNDYDGNYIKSEGDTSYSLSKYSNDLWRVGEETSSYYLLSTYPYYFTYDFADSPIDIDQEWQLANGENMVGPASSNFSVTCEGGYYDGDEGNYSDNDNEDDGGNDNDDGDGDGDEGNFSNDDDGGNDNDDVDGGGNGDDGDEGNFSNDDDGGNDNDDVDGGGNGDDGDEGNFSNDDDGGINYVDGGGNGDDGDDGGNDDDAGTKNALSLVIGVAVPLVMCVHVISGWSGCF